MRLTKDCDAADERQSSKTIDKKSNNLQLGRVSNSTTPINVFGDTMFTLLFACLATAQHVRSFPSLPPQGLLLGVGMTHREAGVYTCRSVQQYQTQEGLESAH